MGVSGEHFEGFVEAHLMVDAVFVPWCGGDRDVDDAGERHR